MTDQMEISDYVTLGDVQVLSGLMDDEVEAHPQVFLKAELLDGEGQAQQITVALRPWDAIKISNSLCDAALYITEAYIEAITSAAETPGPSMARESSPYL